MATSLTLLREATRERHAVLDGSGWFDDATRDLATYAEHITRLSAFYDVAEKAIAAYAAPLTAYGFDPAARRKIDVLTIERAELPAPALPVPDFSRDFPRLPSLSAAVGCIYVLEGSTLGGVVLAARIRERLGRHSRFYGVYGSRTAAMWRSFTAALEAMHGTLDDGDLIASGVAVYDAYAHCVARLESTA